MGGLGGLIIHIGITINDYKWMFFMVISNKNHSNQFSKWVLLNGGSIPSIAPLVQWKTRLSIARHLIPWTFRFTGRSKSERSPKKMDGRWNDSEWTGWSLTWVNIPDYLCYNFMRRVDLQNVNPELNVMKVVWCVNACFCILQHTDYDLH